MSRVAQLGALWSPEIGEVNMDRFLISSIWRSRLSMNEGIASAR